MVFLSGLIRVDSVNVNPETIKSSREFWSFLIPKNLDNFVQIHVQIHVQFQILVQLGPLYTNVYIYVRWTLMAFGTNEKTRTLASQPSVASGNFLAYGQRHFFAN
jgi:hypothetical protein